MEIITPQPNKEQKIIILLFRDILTIYNSRSISKIVGITHAGAFKILKRLEKRGIVQALAIGKAITYSLNFSNPVTHKELELALVLEAQTLKRWLYELRELEDKAQCVILFGSIIINEKKARDVDLLVIAQKEDMDAIRAIIKRKNEVTRKKIHLILQSPEDFKSDVTHKNKVMIEIIKKGIVLFGHENIRRYLTR